MGNRLIRKKGILIPVHRNPYSHFLCIVFPFFMFHAQWKPFFPLPHLFQDIFPGTLHKQWLTFPNSDNLPSGKNNKLALTPPIPPTLLLSEFIVATLWGGVETEWGRELRDMSPSNVSILV